MLRRAAIALALVGPLISATIPSGAQEVRKPPRKISPPGQVQIGTVNARQNEILGLKRILDLIDLAKAFRFRPPAFNGGAQGAVTAPDVLVISEFRPPNVEVFTRLLKLRFDQPYEIVGPDDAQAALVINTATLELQGEVQIVEDVCLNDETSEKPRFNREYPLARFVEKQTGARFAILGVHLARDYSTSTLKNCLVRNASAMRDQLENEPSATFLAGDFNFRPTVEPYECDVHELSGPAEWWAALTMPSDGGRTYLDAVREHHRSRDLSMVDEWTYEHPNKVTTCAGTMGIRRSRIDYLFSSGAVVADAHADHPGWADGANPTYSDHRYVLGRFVLTGPSRPNRVVPTLGAGGAVHLSWEPVEGVTQWILYRARAGLPYGELARLEAETLSFADTDTEHAQTYRYSIAPIGVDGGQGLEAAPSRATPDARGPHVTSVTPAPGAERVSIFTRIRVTFDEWVDGASVRPNTISLFRNGREVAGEVVRKGGFVIKFVPNRPLVRGDAYTIVVRSVNDVLGNAGPVFKSRFSTVPRTRKQRG
ncbi:MAG TPA: Ig-like domain-containing protein [Actinomycetota bacterium]|nr:Ig-like domain-containing protein [Actinomycetota bacterium]